VNLANQENVYSPRFQDNKFILPMLFALIFSSALYGQVSFPQKNLSIPIRRIEKLKISGSVFYWTSTDTTVALVSGGVITPKKIGWTVIIAEDSSRIQKDSCLISIVSWNAGISDFKYELYLSGFKLEGILNDTLMLQAAGYSKDWSSQYFYHSSMSKPKLLSNFKSDGSFSFDIECGLPTPFGNFVLAKRETVNAPRKIYKIDFPSSSTKVVDSAYPPDTNLVPLSTVMYNGWSYDANLRNVYMGQYSSLDTGYENYRIKILKGTDDAAWQTVYTFPARKDTGYYGGIRHVHAVQTDPYTGDVWIATGDANSQSRIYRNTNHMTPDSTGNAPLELVGVGSMEFRVVSFSFSPSYIYYFMDAPSNPQSIFRIPRMSSYPTMYDNKPATLTAYRQLVGTFNDKPFYGNFQYAENGNHFTILEAAWEDVKHYGTSNFREIDSLVRIYAIRESSSGDAQVQEIFAQPGLQDYSHLYPIGMDSKGYMYFSSVFIGQSGLRAVYRGKLTWRELDSIPLESGQNEVSFGKHSVKLSCIATTKDNICAYKTSAPSLDVMPSSIKSVTDNFWNTYIGSTVFSNGVLSIPVNAINNYSAKVNKQLTWVMRSVPGGPWINMGGSIHNDSLISTVPISQLNDFGIALIKFPVKVSPDTITITNPAIGGVIQATMSLYNGTDSTIVIDSIKCSTNNIDLSIDQSTPFLIPATCQVGATAVLSIKSTSGSDNSILVYSGGALVDEVPISQKILMNSSSDPINSFLVSLPYPNPFNGSVNVHCHTQVSGKFYLKIYNVLGQMVYSNDYDALKEGDYNIRWEPRTNPSGVYIMCVQFRDPNGGLTNSINKKITFLK
jgi:hypothetical protein